MKKGLELAQSVAGTACCVLHDGNWYDLEQDVPETAEVITVDDSRALEVIRHTTAHLLAQAVKELYPDAKVGIGPVIENGFYYDIQFSQSICEDDFAFIEDRMRKLIDDNIPIQRSVMSKDEAIQFFNKREESFKVDIIERIPEESVTVYTQGNFTDLCRGPHLKNTGHIPKSFKLLSLAGAYWRGDSKNPILTRIYATAFHTQAQLEEHLLFLEEAKKRDHRKIGKDMDLFHTQEEAAGSVFWHPNGWTLYRTLQEYLRQELLRDGYTEVSTPQMVDRVLWEQSGHWEKFYANMFIAESEGRTYAVKPMNCPGHIQIFKQGIKSYRDLPIRMSEFGICHRNESSGSLYGTMRVRAFVTDDAHIFCREDQIFDETKKFCALLKKIYCKLGFEKFFVRFSTRPELRAGTDEIWDNAERLLAQATQEAGLDYVLNEGDGAFYGPKLEFVLQDKLARNWQCGTLQMDFILPERLQAHYIGADGEKHRPVMLHRAVLGSMERFIGILLENCAGKLPLWLAPVQVMVCTITNKIDGYAQSVHNKLLQAGIRAQLDIRSEKISYKIREHITKNVPIIFVLGKKEAETSTVVIRRGNDQEEMTIEAAIQHIIQESRMPLD